MASQDTLRKLWLQAPEGKLCGREQAKAWALREMWKAEGKGNYGMFALVASKVRKNKDGKPQGDPPSSESMQEFFAKIDDDKGWFPGQHIDEKKRGPKRVLWLKILETGSLKF
jgi:hypothetical protein